MPQVFRSLALLVAIAILVGVSGCAVPKADVSPSPSTSAALPPALIEFRQRLSAVHAQIPIITRSAEAAAARTVAHPLALISTPTSIQEGFAEELSNRAGGLGNVIYPEVRPTEVTPDDVVLFAVRSWEKDGPAVTKLFKDYQAKHWLVIVFGSARGKPADLAADFFIDNDAPGPEAVHGRINAITNVLNGWMWCCEYVAAMTRHGKCPGILMSVSYLKAEMYDAPLQTMPKGRQWQGDCRTPVPAAQLAEIYFKRVEQLAADVGSAQTQEQITEAADIIAHRLAAKRKVMISGIGHVVMDEMQVDHPAGWQGFWPGDVKTFFKKTLKEGDLLYWVGYIGMDSRYADYAAAIRDCKADLIVSLSPDTDPSLNGPWAIARVDQTWALGDAEVPIPCPPGRMGPISGISGTLLMRMVDDQVRRRMAELVKVQSPSTRQTSDR